ncbi:MAG: hypothetical protein JSR86_02335 [Proteobacteria bacterium]|nr:hypothetical protein [Pseudomonadota bacterium]
MKYEFAGPGWMAFMHGLIVERTNTLRKAYPDIGWSICEVFTNPPRALSPGGGALAWHCIVRDGQVTFGAGETDRAEFKVTADYQAVLPLARFDTEGDPARAATLSRMSRDLAARNLLTVIGDRAARHPAIGDFHDVIARVTA